VFIFPTICRYTIAAEDEYDDNSNEYNLAFLSHTSTLLLHQQSHPNHRYWLLSLLELFLPLGVASFRRILEVTCHIGSMPFVA
jgi:hypothetical protein